MIENLEDFGRVEPRINEVLTQYRESPKLLHMLRTYLRQVEEVEQTIIGLPSFLDLEIAVGSQLTLIGKRLGFPREHCVCDIQPVFGFECPQQDGALNLPVVGFCSDATWGACATSGISTVTIADDDIYRGFLQARRFQMQGLFDLGSLKKALRHLWGPTAQVMDHGKGRVVVTPGRDLTDIELRLLQVYPRVIPVGLGIALRFHFGDVVAFGFGTGWGGFCEGTSAVGIPLTGEDGSQITTEDGEDILTDVQGIGADWMCEIDLRPYDCG